MTKADIAFRAQRAKALLDDAMLSEAFTALEAGCIEQLLDTRQSDDETRRLLVERMRAVRAVKELLATEILKGKLEDRQKPTIA